MPCSYADSILQQQPFRAVIAVSFTSFFFFLSFGACYKCNTAFQIGIYLCSTALDAYFTRSQHSDSQTVQIIGLITHPSLSVFSDVNPAESNSVYSQLNSKQV